MNIEEEVYLAGLEPHKFIGSYLVNFITYELHRESSRDETLMGQPQQLTVGGVSTGMDWALRRASSSLAARISQLD